jgi:membrane-bound lytic murein transglycosylase B
MGALLDGQRRRLGTSAALALALVLVLALAGSTSPASRSDAAGATVSPLAGPAPASTAPTDQEAASVTVPDEQRSPESATTPAPAVRITTTGSPVGKAVHADIAGVLLRAYRSAVAGSPPGCHLPVSLLAAIGQVETGSLVGRPIDARHRTSVLGPVLDGRRHAPIPDTDQGRLDGDPTWDRAVGPMQFIPSTWRTFGVDGDGDGVADPQDIEDAAAGTAAYLCYGGRDLTQLAPLRTAILSYNHSVAYLRLVLTYQQRYVPLDSPAATGLPTMLSLTATPIPALQLTPGNRAKPAADTPRPVRHPHRKHATRAASADPSPAPVPATKKAKIHAASAAPHSAPTTPATTPSNPATIPSTTPAAPSSATTPATTPPATPTAPATPAAPGTPAEQTPTGADPPPATPEPTPTPTPEDPQTPQTPGTPAPTDGPTCPTAPLAVDPSSPGAPTPTGIPSDPAQPADPTCAPCPEDVDPTPEAPCQPPTTPAVPVDPAATDPSTAAPSSAQ